VSPAALTFTSANWNIAQTVTVTGVNDDLFDRDQTYQIAFTVVSTDPNYGGRTIPNLDALNEDNDTAGFDRSPGATSITVQEPAETATFTIRLRTIPSGDVVVPLSVSDATELAISPASLTFTPENWSTPQTVTVNAVDELVADGTQTSDIVFGPITSVDPDYNAFSLSNLTVTITDNDVAAITLSKSTVQTFEVGTTDTFTVVLGSEPSVPTTIAVTSSDLTEATVSPAVLEFNASNWNQPQTITVTGVQDSPALLDGDLGYTITLGVPVGAAEYAILGSRNVTGTNIQAFLNCVELLDIHPAAPSGVYELDADRTGPLPKFRGYCDQMTAGGGWTLLSWTNDSAVNRGAPYPGLAYCSDPGFNCTRGSGVPDAASATALFVNSGELGQGQGITTGNTKPTFGVLGSYEFAGSYDYGSLAGLVAATGAGSCAGLVTGTFTTLANASNPTQDDGTAVYLNQGLLVSSAANDYSSDANLYNWSVGNVAGYCTVNGTPPSSIQGTWQQTQYGPAVQNASGSYSVWVR
jgi:hypothetical protein